MSAETIDQYELLKNVFDKLGIDYTVWDRKFDTKGEGLQVLEIFDRTTDLEADFWFKYGEFTKVDIYEV